MNTTELQNRVNTFIDDLCKKEEFSHLAIQVQVSKKESKSGEKVAIESNAVLSIAKSVVADTLISNFINELLNEDNSDEHYVINITYAIIQKNQKETQFQSEKPKYKLADVILPKPKKEEINKALAMITHYEKIYKEWGFEEIDPSSKTILCFYGEPGTGKTMCAHGIAEYLNRPILIASYADIQSEYVGVGPKNLKAIFKQAEEDNAILFFDEADSFLRKRTSDTRDSAAMHYNSMTNEMMKHLEDFNGVVIFATNLTENTDKAFKTRITASIEFPVPDVEMRALLIKGMIPSKAPLSKPFSNEDYSNIASKCDGFVGRDIRNAVKAILAEGAMKGVSELTLQDFEDGFEKYKENKNKLEEDIQGTTSDHSIYEQIEWNSATSLVMAICTYMAWYDGVETEEETEKLKQIAKLLNRDKLIITKLSDLPNLEELCERIKKKKHQIETVKYCISILSTSGDEVRNIDMLQKVCTIFNLDNTILDEATNLYSIEKQRNKVSFGFDNLLNTKD